MSRADRERAEFEKLILQQRADLELLCSMACAWAFEMGREPLRVQCLHGSELLGSAGEKLEPECGCRRTYGAEGGPFDIRPRGARVACPVHPHATGGEVKTIGLLIHPGQTDEEAYAEWALKRGQVCVCSKAVAP